MDSHGKELIQIKDQIDYFEKFDGGFVSIINDKLKTAKNTDEFAEVWTLVSKVKSDVIKFNIEVKNQQIDSERKRFDLLLYKIHKVVSFSVGVGLFGASFFAFPVNPLVGGLFFGTGLGALGISTISIKSVFTK